SEKNRTVSVPIGGGVIKDNLGLVSPPAAQTADSIALLWNKLRRATVESYDVYADDALVATTKHTDYTLRKLSAGKKYSIRITAKIAGGEVVQSDVLRVSTKPAPRLFDITKYGAVG